MKLSDEEFMSKLSKHPSLRSRFEQLLRVIDNPDGKTTRADAAEELVTSELRSLGSEMLHEWAQEEAVRSAETVLNSGVSVKKKSKKKSTGTAPTET